LEQWGVVKLSGGQGRIERFEYPVMPFTPGTPTVFGLNDVRGGSEGEGIDRTANGSLVSSREDVAEKLAEETRRAFEAGRERGLLEGRQLDREEHAAATRVAEDRRRLQAAKLTEQFTQERDRYLHAVEKEVVQLALAVAARILRREAQMDPLLLTGAVRVALGQLSGSTEARVRVPVAELDLWKDALALLPNLTLKPKILAGEGMLLGDCVIETSLGSVDLGIRSQLGEIERGFFDSASRSKAPITVSKPMVETVESRA
jgi:flagellar assembly protein FliH